jgi:hypothetical protein
VIISFEKTYDQRGVFFFSVFNFYAVKCNDEYMYLTLIFAVKLIKSEVLD